MNSVERHNLSDLGVHIKLGKPVCLPTGKLPAKEAYGHAGKGSWKKRKHVSNRQDRAGENQRYPTRKSANFQQVSDDEKACQKSEDSS